jgi:hypothetical protein
MCAAPAMDDVAYFIGGSLTVADRRASERDLVAHYLRALATPGGPRYTVDDVWLDYRRHHLHGFLWAMTGALMQPRERVAAMAERPVQAIEDHNSVAAVAD